MALEIRDLSGDIIKIKSNHINAIKKIRVIIDFCDDQGDVDSSMLINKKQAYEIINELKKQFGEEDE